MTCINSILPVELQRFDPMHRKSVRNASIRLRYQTYQIRFDSLTYIYIYIYIYTHRYVKIAVFWLFDTERCRFYLYLWLRRARLAAYYFSHPINKRVTVYFRKKRQNGWTSCGRQIEIIRCALEAKIKKSGSILGFWMVALPIKQSVNCASRMQT